MPAGSFVMHFGKQVHYDGAKDGDTVVEIIGKRPRHGDSCRAKIDVVPNHLDRIASQRKLPGWASKMTDKRP
jgi:hypothetical protein